MDETQASQHVEEEARNEGGGSNGGAFAVATEADGDEKAGPSPSPYGVVLG